MTPFDESEKEAFWKHCWERRNCLYKQFLLFPQCFKLWKTQIVIFVTFNLSSANAFNLVWSKILSRGKGHLRKDKHLPSIYLGLIIWFKVWPIGLIGFTRRSLTLSQTSRCFYVSAEEFFWKQAVSNTGSTGYISHDLWKQGLMDMRKKYLPMSTLVY